MKAFLLLFLHQLRLVYRDRNTRIYGFLLPLVLYPLLLLLALQGKLVLSGLDLARSSRVLLALEGSPRLEAEIRHAVRPGDRLRLLSRGPGPGPLPQEALLSGRTDAVLARPGGAGPLRLLLVSKLPSSERAARRVRNLLARIQESRLRRAGMTPPPPPTLEVRPVSPPGGGASRVLGRILPLILFVMTSLGAFFPAMEATAAEWERSTLETNLLLPVPRETVLTARIAAVALAAMATAGLNLLGMLLAAGPLLGGGKALLPPVTPAGAAALLALGFLLALFFSSLFLLICSRAKSFREGQAFGTPVLALAMLPGLLPLLPGFTLEHPAWSLPLLGEALAVRAACAPDFSFTGPFLVVLGRLILLDLVLVFGAVRFMERRILPAGGKEVSLR